jgi:DNA-binding response OmpR family regulator
MRILIAEDDSTSRRVLETVLRKQGHEIVAASDGDEAWQLLQAPDAPRLVILDWMMPGVDGPELCRRLRGRESQNPVYIILLTALIRKENIIEGLDAGADDYVTKPFDKDELNARVQVGKRVLDLESALARRVGDLEEALTHVKTLQGILPICMHCHRIRNDTEAWQKLEEYVEDHSEAAFSHSLCPECLEKYYPEIAGDSEK